MAHTSTKKERFIEALKLNAWNISLTCEQMGIGRSTIYGWLKRSPKFKQTFAEAKDALTDLVEGKLLTLIKEGNVTAITFYLRCQGKDRGWVERQELTGKEGEPLEVQVIDSFMLPAREEQTPEPEDESGEEGKN